jgi:DNA-binding NtrC family response regulator
VVKIEIPPLRHRKDDIVPLAHFFLDKFKKRFDKGQLTVDDGVLELLQHYEWPGNVRELENVVQRMVITADQGRITIHDLPDKMQSKRLSYSPEHADLLDMDFLEARKRCLDDFTREYLLSALKYCRGNISKTAKEIRVQRPSIQRMLKRYKITKEEYM